MEILAPESFVNFQLYCTPFWKVGKEKVTEELYTHANDLSTGKRRKRRTKEAKGIIPPLG